MSEPQGSDFSKSQDHSALSREVRTCKGCLGRRCTLLETHTEFSSLSIRVPDAPLLSIAESTCVSLRVVFLFAK